MAELDRRHRTVTFRDILQRVAGKAAVSTRVRRPGPRHDVLRGRDEISRQRKPGGLGRVAADRPDRAGPRSLSKPDLREQAQTEADGDHGSRLAQELARGERAIGVLNLHWLLVEYTRLIASRRIGVGVSHGTLPVAGQGERPRAEGDAGGGN